MITKNIQLGQYGEDLAIKYLQNKEYIIIGRNFRRKCGELDIIAKKNKQIIFIEVKTRDSSKNFAQGTGEEAINYYKQKKLLKTAELFLLEKKLPENIFWQFDVISIIIDKQAKTAKIKLIEDAF